MKIFLAFFIFALSFTSAGAAFAADDRLGLAQCRRFNDNAYYKACIDSAYGNSFEAGIMGQCSRFTDNQYLLSCVRLAANRHFDNRKINLCSRFNDNAWLFNCLRESERNF